MISTIPVFYFVDPVTDGNQFLNFIEPTQANTELTATILPGSRSMTNLASQIQTAMNSAGENEYVVTFNRLNRTMTISSAASFSLLVDSGTASSSSIFPLIGFTGADRTGAMLYTGEVFGSEYSPQFLPQSFKSFDDNERSIASKVNESASGTVVEAITFGVKRNMEMNLKYITDKVRTKGAHIENNQNAVQEARDALSFMIKKREFEFMIDRDNRAVFDTVLLESTRIDRTGSSYELTELSRENLLDYYETGRLTFRKLD